MIRSWELKGEWDEYNLSNYQHTFIDTNTNQIFNDNFNHTQLKFTALWTKNTTRQLLKQSQHHLYNN